MKTKSEIENICFQARIAEIENDIQKAIKLNSKTIEIINDLFPEKLELELVNAGYKFTASQKQIGRRFGGDYEDPFLYTSVLVINIEN